MGCFCFGMLVLAMKNLIFYPHPSANNSNAYLRLLYEALQRQDWGGRRILHIHWEHNLFGSRFLAVALLKFVSSVVWLVVLKVRGFRIVWTLHNFHDHGNRFPGLGRFMRWLLWHMADAVIVQQKSALTRPWPYPRKLHYVPHGNYIDVYGTALPHASSGSVTLLALGAIKPYKNLEFIIDAFKATHDERLRFVIAGEGKADYVRQLSDRAAGDERISIENKFIPDPEIPATLARADYAVFWYDESVLTSGAMILALSYGIPVIARDIVAADVVEEGVNGYRFHDRSDFVRLLAELPSRTPLSSEAVVASVRDASWDAVARVTADIYKNL